MRKRMTLAKGSIPLLEGSGSEFRVY